MKILHIEDDITIARSVSRWLRSSLGLMDIDAQVTIARSAQGAIVRLQEGPFSVVICDYDLDIGGFGTDVLAWLRRQGRPEARRFVFLTGDEHRVAGLGVPVLAKPCEMSALTDVIQGLTQ